eukprot:5316027-Amphidinium_carterae.1
MTCLGFTLPAEVLPGSRVMASCTSAERQPEPPHAGAIVGPRVLDSVPSLCLVILCAHHQLQGLPVCARGLMLGQLVGHPCAALASPLWSTPSIRCMSR